MNGDDITQLMKENDHSNEIIAEFEKYESNGLEFAPISSTLRDSYQNLFLTYSVYRKVLIYRIFEAYNFENIALDSVYRLLCQCPDQSLNWLLSFIYSYHDDSEPRMHTAMITFAALPEKHLIELVGKENKEEVVFLIDILTFSSDVHRKQFMTLLNEMNLHDIFQAIEKYSNKQSKQCHLCKLRKIDAFEYEMNQKDLRTMNQSLNSSKKAIRVTGAVKISTNIDVWKPPDEDLFTFDLEESVIYWKKAALDLVLLCDRCVFDVHGAISTVNRNEPIYHIDPEPRMKVIQQLKQREQRRAALFQAISSERIHRRAKEWVHEVIPAYQHGIKAEENMKLRQEMEEREASRKKAMIEERHRLVTKAMEKDEKWRNSDEAANQQTISAMYSYSMLKYHRGYSDANPYTFARENPLSWQWKQFDDRGTPLTAQAVHQVGNDLLKASQNALSLSNVQMASDEEISKQSEQLTRWKVDTMTKHHNYLTLLQDIEHESKQKREKEYDYYKRYVHQRSREIERKYDIIQRELEEEENRFHAQRQIERKQRRLQLEQQREATERTRMNEEDLASRLFEQSIQQQYYVNEENDRMHHEELLQRRIDRFWGLDEYERQKLQEKDNLRELYEKRVKQMNLIIVKSRELSTQSQTLVAAKELEHLLQSRAIIATERQILEERQRFDKSIGKLPLT